MSTKNMQVLEWGEMLLSLYILDILCGLSASGMDNGSHSSGPQMLESFLELFQILLHCKTRNGHYDYLMGPSV